MLPVFVSLPHAGLEVAPELAAFHQLTLAEIAADGDEQAAEIYAPLCDAVIGHVTTPIARAFVDVNRAPDDIRKDGVVKTHTCWDVPIWRQTPPQEAFDAAIVHHHGPYHAALARPPEGAIVGLDAHTMASHGPPVGPDPGVERPAACIGIADGTCPESWARSLQGSLARTLGREVRINDPFRGGYIIRAHRGELPWLMLELSRGDFMTPADKAQAVLEAVTQWAGSLRDASR